MNKKKELWRKMIWVKEKSFSSIVQITIMNGPLHLTHSGLIHFKCIAE